MEITSKYKFRQDMLVEIEVGISEDSGDKSFWSTYFPAVPAVDEYYIIAAAILGQMKKDKFAPANSWDPWELGNWIRKSIRGEDSPVLWHKIPEMIH